jgi:hypothetical protein
MNLAAFKFLAKRVISFNNCLGKQGNYIVYYYCYARGLIRISNHQVDNKVPDSKHT